MDLNFLLFYGSRYFGLFWKEKYVLKLMKGVVLPFNQVLFIVWAVDEFLQSTLFLMDTVSFKKVRHVSTLVCPNMLKFWYT